MKYVYDIQIAVNAQGNICSCLNEFGKDGYRFVGYIPGPSSNYITLVVEKAIPEPNDIDTKPATRRLELEL